MYPSFQAHQALAVRCETFRTFADSTGKVRYVVGLVRRHVVRDHFDARDRSFDRRVRRASVSIRIARAWRES